MKLDSETVSALLHLVPALCTWLHSKNPKEAGNLLVSYGPTTRAEGGKGSLEGELKEALTALGSVGDERPDLRSMQHSKSNFSLLQQSSPSSIYRTARPSQLAKVTKRPALYLSDILNSSTSELRNIFYKFPDHVWFRLLFTLISSPTAPIVTQNCYDGLVELFEGIEDSLKLPENEMDEMLIDEMRICLERLPFECHMALGEICALIRDTSSNPSSIAGKIAFNIFFPEELNKTDLYSRNLTHSIPAQLRNTNNILNDTKLETKQAKIIFTSLIRYSSHLFFKYPNTISASGFRKKLFNNANDDIFKLEKLTTDLSKFLAKADNMYKRDETKLLSNLMLRLYGIDQICFALYNRYEQIPEGWNSELVSYITDNDLTITWYDESEPLEEIAYTNKVFKPQPKKKRKLVQAEASVTNKYIVECNHVIDEVTNSEQALYQQFVEFCDIYIPALKASSKRTLSDTEIKRVFDNRFISMKNGIGKVNFLFNILRLINEPPNKLGKSNNLDIKSRVGVLAVLISEGLAKVSAHYVKYVSSQSTATEILQEKKVLYQKAMRDLNASPIYLQIWFNERKRGKELNKMAFDSLLQQPVRRIPNYGLFLKKLIKQLGKMKTQFGIEYDEDMKVLHEANREVEKLANTLVTQIKTVSKAAQILGNDVDQHA